MRTTTGEDDALSTRRTASDVADGFGWCGLVLHRRRGLHRTSPDDTVVVVDVDVVVVGDDDDVVAVAAHRAD